MAPALDRDVPSSKCKIKLVLDSREVELKMFTNLNNLIKENISVCYL